MPKNPSSVAVAVPTGRAGRKSPAQEELELALDMLKKGEGVRKDGFIILELESQKNVGSARSALWNLRWKYNTENPECKDKTGGVFDRLFKSAGRGGIQVFAGENESVLIAVPESYATEAGVKATAKAESK